MNPMQIITSLIGSDNPMQMMGNMLQGNPQFNRVMQMVQGKNPDQVKNIAQNLCKERGIDFEDACNELRRMGLKVPK